MIERGRRRRSRRSRVTRCSSTASTRRRRSGSARRSAARSATTTSTIRSARRTTSGSWRSSPTPSTTSRTFGDGTRYFEPTLDLRRRSRRRRARSSRPRSRGWSSELKATTPALARGAGGMGNVAARRGGSVDACWRRRASRATDGVVLTTQPDGSVLASGPNPQLTIVHRRRSTTTLQRHHRPAAGGAARSVAAARRARPRRLRPLPHDRHPRRVAAATPAAGCRRRFVRDDEGGRFGGAVRAAELLTPRPGCDVAGARGRSTRCVTPTRLPRHAVLAARVRRSASPAARAAMRIDQLDGTIGQGVGRFRLSVTAAADPLEGADLPPRLRPMLELAGARRPPQQGEGSRRRLPRRRRRCCKPTRDAPCRGAQGARRPADPSTLVMGERPGFERPSFELRVRGSFAAKGERVYARTPAALHPMRDDQPVNRLGLARWLVDENNPLVARVAVNRLVGAAVRARHWSKRARTSARRARRRRIRSCSTGWRRSSSRQGLEPEGAHPRRSSRRRPTGSRRRSRPRSRNAIRTTGCSPAARASAWKPK